MKPYSGCCPFCGHIWKGLSRRHTWEYFINHCRKTKNHPIVEPSLMAITPFKYWLWKFNKNKGRLEQLERHSLQLALAYKEYSSM